MYSKIQSRSSGHICGYDRQGSWSLSANITSTPWIWAGADAHSKVQGEDHDAMWHEHMQGLLGIAPAAAVAVAVHYERAPPSGASGHSLWREQAALQLQLPLVIHLQCIVVSGRHYGARDKIIHMTLHSNQCISA